MDQNKVNAIIEKQREKNREIYDSFEIGQTVEFQPTDGDFYETDEYGNVEAKVIDKSYSQFGCDLRVDLDGSGTELWIDAEDAM